MNILSFLASHYYHMTIRENGKWMFRRNGWKKRTYEELVDQRASDLLIFICAIILMLIVLY